MANDVDHRQVGNDDAERDVRGAATMSPSAIVRLTAPKNLTW